MSTNPNIAENEAKVTAQALFDKAFSAHRTPRSAAYRAGLLAHLKYRMLETDRCVAPFEQGTAECDAWLSSYDESWLILDAARCDRRLQMKSAKAEAQR